MLPISVIILTYNEEQHIERCIANAKRFSTELFVIDSFSTDKTVEIAESLGAIVLQNTWENNYAKQFNYGLQNAPITQPWTFRLDADEYLTDALIEELQTKFESLSDDVSGVIFERKMYFLNELMTKGMLQMNMLRLFRTGHGFCEERWMDEHIVLTQGRSIKFNNYFVDHNLNSLGWWIQKHNGYSIREAVDLLNLEYGFLNPKSEKNEVYEISDDAKSKRDKKKRYVKMSLFWRSFAYFFYRYIFKLGFTQGKEGFLWHFLQGWWYRTLVDAKIYEIKKACGDDPEAMKKYIIRSYNLNLE